MLAGLFASGRAADVVLLVLAVEAGWLIARGRPALPVLAMLAPAALFVLALRAALVDAAWPWVALPLALSGPAHVIDLRLRRAA